MTKHKINRLFQLTPHTAILMGGSIKGAKICDAPKDFIGQEQLEDIEDVYKAALPFPASEYAVSCGKHASSCRSTPSIRFILSWPAIRSETGRIHSSCTYLDEKNAAIDGDEISTAYSVPRLITLESHLNQRCQENEPLNQIIPLIRDCLDKQSSAHDEIAGPFSFASITRDGFEALSN